MIIPSSQRLRTTFLEYFREHGHQVVPSAGLIPRGDPSLLFVNAGMVPFKSAFLGETKPPYSRATSLQKCLRVSGKHNDLENVGRTPRHHTLFEMLGNFSFGDYFKHEAIGYAWTLLRDRFGFAPEQLAATVYERDDESIVRWTELGMLADNIYRLEEQENFWQMGETGPCGPCSEIQVVLGPKCSPTCSPLCECGAFLELWNLVFMSFNRTADGELEPLPKRSIDTGLGFERLVRTLHGATTNFDTDLFLPLIERTCEISGRSYHADGDTDVSLRVVADHARACCFLIAEGVLPASAGRGYVLRRLLRRAARHGVLLGVDGPFLHRLAPVVAQSMGEAYPEVAQRMEFIADAIEREERRFGRTLERGLDVLDRAIAEAVAAGRDELAGDVIFKLYDTFGFPLDLTVDVLRGRGLGYDHAAFAAQMKAQSDRARTAWKGSGEAAPNELLTDLPSSVFVGYERLDETTIVEAIVLGAGLVDAAAKGESVVVVLAESPFFGASGGQVGDVGVLELSHGRVSISDVIRPAPGVIAHVGVVTDGGIRVGDRVVARVDAEHRAAAARNHSATHLLHHALRELLGPHVVQAGSHVGADRLRFDFSHDRPIDAETLREVEGRVNAIVLANAASSTEERSYDEAIASGALALFGEKYRDDVRVVRVGPSIELCGGTHVERAGSIGSFRIVGQSAVAAGVRRIEAVTGLAALAFARQEHELLLRSATILGTAPATIAERAEQLVKDMRGMAETLERARDREIQGRDVALAQRARPIGSARVLVEEIEGLTPKELRDLVDRIKRRLGSGVVMLAARTNGGVSLALGVTDDLAGRVDAGRLIKAPAAAIGGAGGGRAGFAQAGGDRTEAVATAMDDFRAELHHLLAAPSDAPRHDETPA